MNRIKNDFTNACCSGMGGGDLILPEENYCRRLSARPVAATLLAGPSYGITLESWLKENPQILDRIHEVTQHFSRYQSSIYTQTAGAICVQLQPVWLGLVTRLGRHNLLDLDSLIALLEADRTGIVAGDVRLLLEMRSEPFLSEESRQSPRYKSMLMTLDADTAPSTVTVASA